MVVRICFLVLSVNGLELNNNMYKVYLNNQAHWFDNLVQRDEFIQAHPAATVREFNQYWDRNAGAWLDK